MNPMMAMASITSSSVKPRLPRSASGPLGSAAARVRAARRWPVPPPARLRARPGAAAAARARRLPAASRWRLPAAAGRLPERRTARSSLDGSVR